MSNEIKTRVNVLETSPPSRIDPTAVLAPHGTVWTIVTVIGHKVSC